MKKLILAVAALPAMMGMTSCGGSDKLSTETDSVSYALGMVQGQQMANNIKMQAQYGGPRIDSIEFLKGFMDGIKADTSKFSYFAGAITGCQLAQNMMRDTTMKFNLALTAKGYETAFKGDTVNTLGLNFASAQAFLQAFGEKKQAEEMNKKFGKNKELGAQYIAKLKDKGYEMTKSGIAYKIKQEGNGVSPLDTDTVEVRYEGRLINGTVFDKSNKDGKNAAVSFPVNGVIKGWTEMLKMMKPGEKMEIVIPENLAYGVQNQGQIEPFSTLIFDVELVNVKKAK